MTLTVKVKAIKLFFLLAIITFFNDSSKDLLDPLNEAEQEAERVKNDSAWQMEAISLH